MTSSDHLECLKSDLFGQTSPVALDAVLSQEENMHQTAADFEAGTDDTKPFGYETIWSQLGCQDFEGEALGWDMRPEEIRAAYRLVDALDLETLEAFAHREMSADGLVTRIKDEARAIALAEAGDEDGGQADEEPAGDTVQCPKCQGKMGFSQFTHVPHKRVGGLCFECDGKGVVLVDDAEAYAAKLEAQRAGRRSKERERAAQRAAKLEADHASAFDAYGDEYRLVYALARYDHPATGGAVFDLNAYRSHDKAAMRRVRDRLEYLVQEAGLEGLGLEEIEALGTLDPDQ